MADAKKISKLLLGKYPQPKIALNFSNPLELLVATILSARCTDVKVNEVTKNLFRKYKTAGDYARADIKTFEQEIKPTGFYRNKAKMVIECCKKIIKDFNGKVPDTLDKLTTLPGVGRKTANVVLGSAFGKQTLAVDTHVLRVSNRLGIAHSSDPDKVEEELVAQLPEKTLTSFNLALILHGRETCTAINRSVLFVFFMKNANGRKNRLSDNRLHLKILLPPLFKREGYSRFCREY
jgi:endonuclease-3